MGSVIARLVSTNPHKARELERALHGWKIELLTAEVPEEGKTYYENALAKALFGRSADPDAWILGEDSGIEAAALDGAPGIHSARWAEEGGHVSKLLEAVDDATDRHARFVCELVCLSPEGDEYRGTGALEGTVALEPRGSEGFGYDPVFLPEGETQTVAELGDEWKAEHSHRARAARALLKALQARPGASTSASLSAPRRASQ